MELLHWLEILLSLLANYISLKNNVLTSWKIPYGSKVYVKNNQKIKGNEENYELFFLKLLEWGAK